ncbi:MAG: hypothetical protein K1X92_03445 [Bacteroidia bacterium]|nr:hypothetical protein [Bacteroidia bacterium]
MIKKEYFNGDFSRILGLIVICLITGCVSRETYDDVKYKNATLLEQVERAGGLNRQLQEYVDRHIQESHAGENIVVPDFTPHAIPSFVKDSEIRELKIEINRLKREAGFKDKLIRELRNSLSIKDTGISLKVEQPKME